MGDFPDSRHVPAAYIGHRIPGPFAMDEHAIFVIPIDGRWSVSASQTLPGARYDDRALAVAAARRACRHKWEIEGAPCVVRLRDDEGRWRELELFGTAWS